MSFNIIPINTGFIKVNKGYITFGGNANKSIEIPATAWYLSDGNEKILIDTGMCDTDRANKWHHPGSYQPSGFRIDVQLQKLGVGVEEIDTIIFTHLHWDHCSNMNLFVNAKFLVSSVELEFAINPLPPYYCSYEHPILGIIPPFKGKKFITLKGEYKYNDNIVIFPTPGHSPGHQSVSVKTDSGTFIIAGDAVFSEKNLESNPRKFLKFIPIGRYMNFFDMWNSLYEIDKRGDYVLPGHDISVFKHEVYPFK